MTSLPAFGYRGRQPLSNACRWAEDGKSQQFAAGDVRSGASKRVAGAVGDGAMVVRFAYEVLAG